MLVPRHVGRHVTGHSRSTITWESKTRGATASRTSAPLTVAPESDLKTAMIRTVDPVIRPSDEDDSGIAVLEPITLEVIRQPLSHLGGRGEGAHRDVGQTGVGG